MLYSVQKFYYLPDALYSHANIIIWLFKRKKNEVVPSYLRGIGSKILYEY